ncbi:hypothetical protein NQ317_013604 [Molorchus minor]|uniref:Uncharacterized protein n=1 Tax=Molorchus minor TaxID=1323400 RepID=A0ABQ9IR62_9CUCU|nr:hypothetical protein NQ317_013604 [Molorchus minor]
MITDKPSSTLTTGNVGVNIVKMLGINKWGVANLDTKFGNKSDPSASIPKAMTKKELKKKGKEQKTCSILFPMGRRPCERNCHVISYNMDTGDNQQSIFNLLQIAASP